MSLNTARQTICGQVVTASLVQQLAQEMPECDTVFLLTLNGFTLLVRPLLFQGFLFCELQCCCLLLESSYLPRMLS